MRSFDLSFILLIMRKLKLDELGRLSADEFHLAKKIPVSVLLDNIRSMHNVGSALRTSDAFLVEKLYMSGITGTPPHRDIRKTALGAEETVAWEYIPDPMHLLDSKKEEGYRIISVEQAEASISLEDFKPSNDEKYLLIFGNEVEGVSNELFELSDSCIEIPQFGTKHSLNISVSLGIVLWHFAKSLIKIK